MLSAAFQPGSRRAAAATLGLLAIAAVAGLSAGRGVTAAELPVAVAPAPVATDEDVAVQITLSGTDADGESLTFAIADQPDRGTLGSIGAPNCTAGPPSSCDATVTYNPGLDLSGPDSFTFTVDDDADGTSTAATVSITVNPVNDPPDAINDFKTVQQNAGIAIMDVVGNDTDVEGDEIEVADASNPDNGVTIVQNGVLRYAPDQGFHGTDTFTYIAEDESGGQDTATVTVRVNSPTVAVDDEATGPEDEPLDIFVLQNDTDADDVLLVSDATDGAHGTVEVLGAGNNIYVQYTPDQDFNGLDEFTYTAGDGLGSADTATVSVTITPVNDDPVADNENVTGFEDQPRAISVLIGDTDVDLDSLLIVDSTDGANGTVAIITSGTRVRYTPDADFNGPDTFTYTVDDGQGGQDTATVTITLSAVNDAPTIEVPFEPVVTEDDGAQSFGGFLDGVEGPPDEIPTQEVDFAIDDVTATSLFSVQPSVNPNGTLHFTPAPNANGTSTVTVHSFDTGGTANGGVDESPTQSFTITITPVNDAPTAGDDGTPTPLAVAQNAGPTLLNVLANDTALPDNGETLEIVAVTQGANGAVAITGGGSGLTYDPTGAFTGADTFSYTITDGVLEATATVHVSVAPDITPPVTSIRVVGAAAKASTSLRVTVRWSAVELQSGVTLYQLQQQTDGGGWVTIALPTPTTTSIERVLAGGHDYTFRVRARDGIGNLGAYATSRPMRL